MVNLPKSSKLFLSANRNSQSLTCEKESSRAIALPVIISISRLPITGFSFVAASSKDGGLEAGIKN